MTNKAKERLLENTTLAEKVETINNNWRPFYYQVLYQSMQQSWTTGLWISMTNKAKERQQECTILAEKVITIHNNWWPFYYKVLYQSMHHSWTKGLFTTVSMLNFGFPWRINKKNTLAETVESIHNNCMGIPLLPNVISFDAAILDKGTFTTVSMLKFGFPWQIKQTNDNQKTQLWQRKLKLTIISGDLFTTKFYINRCSNSGQSDFLQLFHC